MFVCVKSIKKIIYLLCVFCISIPLLNGQQTAKISFTDNADYYFSDADYNQIVFSSILKYAKRNINQAQISRIPKIITEGNENIVDLLLYSNCRNAISEVLASANNEIVNSFTKLGKQLPVPGSNNDDVNNSKNKYREALDIAIKKTISNSESIQSLLKKNDQNDRILSFFSNIKIDENGKILVTENIIIYNGNGVSETSNEITNDEIKRGIVREFPTKYKLKSGLFTKVPFKIIEIKKDGIIEPFHTEMAKNGTVIYVGSSDVYLGEGIFEYSITYETANFLIFNNDEAELYWNVNGNGWSFACEQIGCSIQAPANAKLLESKCFTGLYGSTESNCQLQIVDGHTPLISTNKPLNPYEGLSIAVIYDKNAFIQKSQYAIWFGLLKDNFILPILGCLILLIFGVNYRNWYLYGRDPEKGIAYPQFEPPKDFSPADCGYTLSQKYEPHLLAAALVDMAVNKKVSIEVEKEGLIFKSNAYHFNAPENFQLDEQDDIFYKWYGFSPESLHGEQISKGNYNANFAAKNGKLKNSLKERLELAKIPSSASKNIFSLNQGFVGLGFFLIIISTIGAGFFVGFHQSKEMFFYVGILVVLAFVIQIVFSKILSAYTIEGRKRVNEIVGFKMYLSASEEKIFDQFTPPQKTLQLFERFLPYAIALKCENQWSKQFESQLEKAIRDGYQPTYYSSNFGSSINSNSFASTFSSNLSHTISSASTMPSSSGSSGGGGFSGGGGGGGGGGGW